MSHIVGGRDLRPVVSHAQMAELKRLGFRGPVAWLLADEADEEIERLRQDQESEQQAANRFSVSDRKGALR